ncbi:hypothetical protein A6F57_19690 [Alteromonas stellipolaris]|uniref:helix-turn-helix transcriptional regulator n=1 Tax=Alteromonas stellipolaris TaxID=233316 RepID=UPI0007B44B52|nr:response regulator transcription factor [Alteromonas stellipolaris]ANB27204.1 hypothetical protein A6F57_19690 [Alteromonas stellipolaris]
MQTTRTEKGYQLESIQVDSKPFSSLPTQQARTLLFVAQGLPQKAIADAMGVKLSTVKKACGDLNYRLNTHTMRETVHQAIKLGILRYSLCITLCLISATYLDAERAYKSSQYSRVSRAASSRRLKQNHSQFLAA